MKCQPFLVDSLKDKCSFNRKLRTSSNLGEKTQISTMRFVASSTVDITILKKIENRPKNTRVQILFSAIYESARMPPFSRSRTLRKLYCCTKVTWKKSCIHCSMSSVVNYQFWVPRDVKAGIFWCDLCNIRTESAPLVGIGLRYLKI